MKDIFLSALSKEVRSEPQDSTASARVALWFVVLPLPSKFDCHGRLCCVRLHFRSRRMTSVEISQHFLSLTLISFFIIVYDSGIFALWGLAASLAC